MNRFLSHLTMPIFCMVLTITPAFAGPGHDHGDEAPAVAETQGSPRFEAHSDLFEAVGVLEGDHLSVFVDRFADNAPVLKATVELESGDIKAVGEFHEEHGDYSFAAASFNKPGSYPITLTITSGDEVDVLAGNLVVPDEHTSHGHDESTLFNQAGLWALALVILAALVWTARLLIKRRNTGVSK